MSPVFPRIIFFLIFMILGGSFLPVLFGSSAPFLALLFSLAATLSLMHGFRRVWSSVLVAGLFADVVTLSPLGMAAAFSIGVSYVAGFASHRIVTEHGFLLHIFGGFAVSVTLGVFRLVSGMIFGAGSESVFGLIWPAFVSGFIAFPLTFLLFRRFERWVSSFEAPRL